MVGPVGRVEQRLGARGQRLAGAAARSPVEHQAADPLADLGRARLAGDHDVAAVRAAARRRAGRPGSTCRRPRRPRRPRTRRGAATGSGGAERPARAASPTGRRGPARPACRPSGGTRRCRRARRPRRPRAAASRVVEMVKPRSADGELRVAAEADQHAGQRDGQHQHDPGAGLHEGEHPAAYVVGDLAAEQRGAGQERHAGADADQQRADDRRSTGARRRPAGRPAAPASTIYRPNQRRRDSAPISFGPAAMPMRQTDEDQREQHVEGGVAAAERLGVELGACRRPCRRRRTRRGCRAPGRGPAGSWPRTSSRRRTRGACSAGALRPLGRCAR